MPERQRRRKQVLLQLAFLLILLSIINLIVCFIYMEVIPTLHFPNITVIQVMYIAEKNVSLPMKRKKNSLIANEKWKWLFAHELMQKLWKSHSCYKENGVNGSNCSIIRYLSEVEEYCPAKDVQQPSNFKINISRSARINTDLHGLIDLLRDSNGQHTYAWIRLRVLQLWPEWTEAIHSLSKKQNLLQGIQYKVFLHLGLLSQRSRFRIAENQFKGGPLGELVQWSDLIAALYVLGHNLTITAEDMQLHWLLSKDFHTSSPCHQTASLSSIIIYTDITGLHQIKRRAGIQFNRMKCLFRVLDSFGTEPAYNNRGYARKNKILTAWGGNDLDVRQFFTMFPHSPDNSFLGFVVRSDRSISSYADRRRDSIAVIYGKAHYMWKGKEDYLRIISKYMDVHSTVFLHDRKLELLPEFVRNHGILNGSEFQSLLQKSKIFVGLGFPYEGPAPLEAIANGAVFLNPRFSPPHNNKNTAFFRHKPTERKHPYAELFIGKPHVYTVDMSNFTEVGLAVEEILKHNQFAPHVPFEFTAEGMLQRVNAYVQHQQFCRAQHDPPTWPPLSSVTYLLGRQGESCAQTCWVRGLICESIYFPAVNSEAALRNFTVCSSITYLSAIFPPAVGVRPLNTCFLQETVSLFSCVGEREDLRRLCPCRDYIVGQTALCRACPV